MLREAFERRAPAQQWPPPRTLASITRVKQLAANLNAKVIVQHDWRDVDLLPHFPNFARWRAQRVQSSHRQDGRAVFWE
jgi:hypothetical protein